MLSNGHRSAGEHKLENKSRGLGVDKISAPLQGLEGPHPQTNLSAGCWWTVAHRRHAGACRQFLGLECGEEARGAVLRCGYMSPTRVRSCELQADATLHARWGSCSRASACPCGLSPSLGFRRGGSELQKGACGASSATFPTSGFLTLMLRQHGTETSLPAKIQLVAIYMMEVFVAHAGASRREGRNQNGGGGRHDQNGSPGARDCIHCLNNTSRHQAGFLPIPPNNDSAQGCRILLRFLDDSARHH